MDAPVKLLSLFVASDSGLELQISGNIGMARMPKVRTDEDGGEEGVEIHIQLERLQQEKKRQREELDLLEASLQGPRELESLLQEEDRILQAIASGTRLSPSNPASHATETLSVEAELEALQNPATERLLRQQQWGSSHHHASAYFSNGMDAAEGSSAATEGRHFQDGDGVRKERAKRGRKKGRSGKRSRGSSS